MSLAFPTVDRYKAAVTCGVFLFLLTPTIVQCPGSQSADVATVKINPIQQSPLKVL